MDNVRTKLLKPFIAAVSFVVFLIIKSNRKKKIKKEL